MKIENKLGLDFDSLAQRIMYSYIATYPGFKPVDNGISYESQKQMYNFVADTLFLIYEHSEILGVEDEPDAYYENWALNNSNPSLIKSMEKIESKFADFIDMLIKIGLLGEIDDNKLTILKVKWALTKPIKSKLELLGISCEQSKEQSVLFIEKYPFIFEAWKAYSENDDMNKSKISKAMAFIHGRYYGRKYRAVDYFGELVENVGLLEKMEDYLELNNFIFDNSDLNTNTRYAYVQWIKKYPKNEIACMRASFNWRKKNQMIFEFRLPQFRIMLNSYNQMDVELQKFVFDRLKICDSCGYCTQTDKSGKRPCLAMNLIYDGTTRSKCPLYPNLTWNYINGNDMNHMVRLFELSERML
jgi:hypothetical protein